MSLGQTISALQNLGISKQSLQVALIDDNGNLVTVGDDGQVVELPPSGGGEGTGSLYERATVTLNAATIKTMSRSANFVNVVPSPGSGKFIEPIRVVAIMSAATTFDALGGHASFALGYDESFKALAASDVITTVKPGPLPYKFSRSPNDPVDSKFLGSSLDIINNNSTVPAGNFDGVITFIVDYAVHEV